MSYRLRIVLLATALSVVLGACAKPAVRGVVQRADLTFEYANPRPAYAPDAGPLVLVDEAHANYHTADGRFAPFAKLLRGDGFVVRPLAAVATSDALRDASVLVIANGLAPQDIGAWRLPTSPALEAEEIEAIRAWVERGGALLLIADHMPFPGAVADLAAEFDILFANGFAFGGSDGTLRFVRDDGTLRSHVVTDGRDAGERVEHVVTFTGQAFRAVRDVEPLLVLGPDTALLMPSVAWQFDEMTPSLPAEGLLQGVVFEHGAGRVAVFGEAAMFTAQEQIREDARTVMGMNAPEASDNPRFILNLMRWLVGDSR